MSSVHQNGSLRGTLSVGTRPSGDANFDTSGVVAVPVADGARLSARDMQICHMVRRLPTGARLEMLILTRRLWVEFWSVMAERSPVEMQICCSGA